MAPTARSASVHRIFRAAPSHSSNNNDRLNVANNRIVANGGTNLAGALGLFAGADDYTVTGNDFCGNFSAEYGGAISHYGWSNNGSITRNRIYYNQGYDEGGGIMIAGALPANNNALSPGAGSVTIDGNTLISNQSNDDGGGIRFLMAGVAAQLVENNIIANNLSTHEGGGVAIDDTPNVTLVNNTIVKNITTATAATNGAVGNIKQANPAGLSTGGNSSLLQATLPSGSPLYSNPKLFNNIFADNRAGWAELPTRSELQRECHPRHRRSGDSSRSSVGTWVLSAGSARSARPTASSTAAAFTAGRTRLGPATWSPAPPTRSSLGTSTVLRRLVASGSSTRRTSLVDSLMWRNNTNTSFPVIVAHMVPVNLLANYHLLLPSGLAFNGGAASKTGGVPSVNTPAPNHDIDNQGRPQLGGIDIGADEVGATTADLSITKTDGVTSTNPGATLTYTITVSNAGPDAVTGATVVDTLPAGLTGTNLNTTVNLAPGASQVYTLTATVAASASLSVSNTATVAAPGVTDAAPGNNSATDTDSIVGPRPTLTVLDNFNRANANTLGGNWSQASLFGSAALRVNTNQAFANSSGNAYWNGAGSTFGAKQAAAFTVANATVNGDSLILKSSGGSLLGVSQNFIRVQYQTAGGGQVVVETTTTFGLTTTQTAVLPGAFANGDTLTALANTDGSVDVWKTTGANVTTYLGRSATSATFAAGTGTVGSGCS